MRPEQARNLVVETFMQPFDRSRFSRFAQSLLNHLDASKQKKCSGNVSSNQAFKETINHYERLGSYTDPNGEKIDVLAVYLKCGTTLERGRTSLRNFAADYLTQRDKAAVLVAFVSQDPRDWRFSFVKLEHALEETDDGKVRERKELTPAKRHSFIVGSNESSHTAQKQFLPLLENDTNNPTLAEIEKAFDIERITKEFFARYKELFEGVRDTLDAVLKKSKLVRDEFELRGMGTDDFAKKLLGQVVFLYFLQKKGWFGVERDAVWGTGDKNYLRHLFEHRETYYQHSEKQAKHNFFKDILEPLFYKTLSAERTDDYSRLFHCKIPFLNGGLFKPLFGYDWVNTDILLPDKFFSNDELTKEGDSGTGILDVFDRYNFTVSEAEPLEKDIAVDPEMLGKVFENLLPENLRHKGGTYYTPRVVVNYMCRQSLINYLATHLPEIPRTDLETFIRIGHVQADFEAAGTRAHKDKLLPQTISRNAKDIDKLLEEITVCDPAIGSGAFPVGMMQEIVRARQALAFLEGVSERSAYDLKRHTIQNSLYGVDIDSGAVEIAKLRLWLSLVVDEEDRERIQALPNLDYKIMQGNSLLDEFAGVKLLHFVEVFQSKSGFDVVIGNPPYGGELTVEEKEFCKAQYSDVHIRTPDTFNYFISKSLRILDSEGKGLLSFIVPNNLLFQNEYVKTRELLLNNQVLTIVNLGDAVFENAIVPSCVLLVRNRPQREYDFEYADLRAQKQKLSDTELDLFLNSYSKKDVLQTPSYVFGVNKAKVGILKRVEELSLKIDDIAEEVASGISTGGDKVFRISANFAKANDLEREVLHEVLKGREINKYLLEDTGHLIIYTHKKVEIEKYPNVYGYLKQFKEQLSKKRETRQGKLPWWCLHWHRYPELFEGEKILIRQTSDELIATLDTSSYYALNSLLLLKVKATSGYSLKFVLAVMNSTLCNFVYKQITQEEGRAFAEVKPQNVRKLYIPKNGDKEQKDKMELLVEKILAAKRPDAQAVTAELEREIDRLVYQLYDLNEDEISIVEGRAY